MPLVSSVGRVKRMKERYGSALGASLADPQRTAVFFNHDLQQFLRARRHRVVQTLQISHALLFAAARKAWVGGFCRGNRGLRILLVRQRDPGDRRPGRGTDEFQHFLAVRFNEAAVDINVVYRFHGISADE